MRDIAFKLPERYALCYFGEASHYMGKSIGNAIVGVYTALNLTGWWPVTAIAWVTA